MRTHGYKPRPAGTLHETIARAIDQTPGGREACADALGARWSPTRLYDATDPNRGMDKGARVYLDEARALTRAYPGHVTAFAEDFARLAGGAFLPAFDPGAGPLGSLAAEFGRNSGKALAEIYDALADGRMDQREAQAALPEVARAIRAAVALYQRVHAIADPDSPAGGSGVG